MYYLPYLIIACLPQFCAGILFTYFRLNLGIYASIFAHILLNVITAKPKAHAFKNEMCFPLTKTKCELKKHPNSKFECFFNDFNRTKTSLFLPFPSKLIQDNLVCVLELQE